jgi:signal peptidase I
MTVMPRIPSRKSKRRRTSFVPATTRSNAVPDALSWRDQLDGTTAPKGQAAWMAASRSHTDRTVIDAGPYGVIDLAAAETMGGGRDQQLGVVWWDKRSFREEDDDDSTIQTSFVPAPISDHVSLATPSLPSPSLDEATVWPLGTIASSATRRDIAAPASHLGEAHDGPRRARNHASLPGATAPVGWPVAARERALAEPGVFEPTVAPPIRAARPSELDDSEHKRHARRSRHVALVPTGGKRLGPSDPKHPRRAMLRRRRTRRRVVLGAILVIIAFVTTILLQNAFITPFTVPSVSMENTLHVGDRILVNKLAYGASSVNRGDVVVFTDPGGWLDGKRQAGDNGDYLVKRVIGIPGDHVACCSTDGRVTVNGSELDEQFAVIPAGSMATVKPFEVTVPAGDLWVLGDNRRNSRDSSQTQALSTKGFVPIADVVGQAVFKIWPLTEAAPIGTARETFASIRDESCLI